VPTYDYVCDACGFEFEHFQSMTDARLSKCPKCGKKKLVRKVGSGGGVIFKGSGFYETDYKRAATKSAEASKPAEAKSSDAGASEDSSAATKSAPDASSNSSKASNPSKSSSKSSKPAPGTCAAGDGTSK
jgi:putative FmdB family regulatory protein